MVLAAGGANDLIPSCVPCFLVALGGGLCGGFLAALLLWVLCGFHSSGDQIGLLTGIALAHFIVVWVRFLMLTQPLE